MIERIRHRLLRLLDGVPAEDLRIMQTQCYHLTAELHQSNACCKHWFREYQATLEPLDAIE